MSVPKYPVLLFCSCSLNPITDNSKRSQRGSNRGKRIEDKNKEEITQSKGADKYTHAQGGNLGPVDRTENKVQGEEIIQGEKRRGVRP